MNRSQTSQRARTPGSDVGIRDGGGPVSVSGQDTRNNSTKATTPSQGTSLSPKKTGANCPKGIISRDFDLAPVRHSDRPLLEKLRDIGVALNLLKSRGPNSYLWRMRHDIKQTERAEHVSLKTGAEALLSIQLHGPLAGVSAVHIMNPDGFILDSATHIGGGTWVFNKVPSEYRKNPLILFQTERDGGKVTNEFLPLKALKAH